MNRDIVSVLLGGFGTKGTGGGEAMKIEGEATMTNSKDVAESLTEAKTVRLTKEMRFCAFFNRVQSCEAAGFHSYIRT